MSDDLNGSSLNPNSERRERGYSYLLAQEISDLQRRSIILNDAVDGKMGVDSTHLVFESLQEKVGRLGLKSIIF